MTIERASDNDKAKTYFAYVNPSFFNQFSDDKIPTHVEIFDSVSGRSTSFKVMFDEQISPNSIAINSPSRTFMNVGLKTTVRVTPYFAKYDIT